VAAVVHAGRVVNTFALSPFTNPVATHVSNGFGASNALLRLLALIVSGAGVTDRIPGTKVIVYFVELSPEHEIGYVPTGAKGVAVVVQVNVPVSTERVSPFTNPLAVTENAGFAAP
jgi:hypothetical protein